MTEHGEQANRRVRVTALEREALEAVDRIAAPKRVESQCAAGQTNHGPKKTADGGLGA